MNYTNFHIADADVAGATGILTNGEKPEKEEFKLNKMISLIISIGL